MLAAALWASGNRQARRAAWRGLGSMAAAFATGAAIEMPSLARGMAPAYRPHLADGCLDIRVLEATVLARSRLVAAVLTGTLGRSRVYRSWQAGSVDVRAADGQPIWLSTDGEVATAETGFTHGKIPHGLVVYRRWWSTAGGLGNPMNGGCEGSAQREGWMTSTALIRRWVAHGDDRDPEPSGAAGAGRGRLRASPAGRDLMGQP